MGKTDAFPTRLDALFHITMKKSRVNALCHSSVMGKTRVVLSGLGVSTDKAGEGDVRQGGSSPRRWIARGSSSLGAKGDERTRTGDRVMADEVTFWCIFNLASGHDAASVLPFPLHQRVLRP